MVRENYKKADYIYVERCKGERIHLYKEQHQVGQKSVVKVCQTTKETMTPRQRRLCDRKLLNAIKKLWGPDTVVVGDKKITSDWGMPNALFGIKKQALLQDVENVLDDLSAEAKVVRNESELKESNVKNATIKNLRMENTRMENENSKKMLEATGMRKSFLLVMDSKAWTYKEVELILRKAQQRYEDIYVVPKRYDFDLEEMSDYFLEEYGLVLHMLEDYGAQQKSFDTIFFLLERGSNCGNNYLFRNQYRIVEWEENQFQSLLFVALNDTINDSKKKDYLV